MNNTQYLPENDQDINIRDFIFDMAVIVSTSVLFAIIVVGSAYIAIR